MATCPASPQTLYSTVLQYFWLKSHSNVSRTGVHVRMVKRTRTIESATTRHLKRLCVSLDSWCREVLGWPQRPQLQQPYPVSQLAVVRYIELELEAHEERLKSGGHTGEELHWDTWEYEFQTTVTLAGSLQRNEPEREAPLAAAGGEVTPGAASAGDCTRLLLELQGLPESVRNHCQLLCGTRCCGRCGS